MVKIVKVMQVFECSRFKWYIFNRFSIFSMPPLIFVSNEALHSWNSPRYCCTFMYFFHCLEIVANKNIWSVFNMWRLATKKQNTGKTYSRDRGRGCHDCDIHEVLKCGDVTNSWMDDKLLLTGLRLFLVEVILSKKWIRNYSFFVISRKMKPREL